MANYAAVARTNYFRVTDEEKYQKLFKNLRPEGHVVDFSCVVDDQIWHGFGAFTDITYGDEENSYSDIDIFITKLQDILPDDEAFIYVESGHENLRAVTGYYIVATKKEIRYGNMCEQAARVAGELLGDPEWKTQLEY